MKKNVAGQFVGAMVIAKADGTPVTTGTTTVSYVGDNGSYTTGSVGSGAASHKGGGYWEYAPSQGETNFDHVSFVFVNTNGVNAAIQIYTSFPQTGDNYARLGAPAGASVSADVAAVKAQLVTVNADTDDIQTRLPAALVGGRMDSSVGAMANNVMTAAAAAPDLTTELQSGLATSSSITALQTSVDDLPTNAELATALGTADDATLAAIATLAGYVDTEVAAIKVVTDKLDTTVEVDGGVYRFTTNALEMAPTGGGGGGATAADIADAVWDEPIADHLDAGSTGESLNGAGSAGNPWVSVIEGTLNAGDILRVLAGVAAGKSTQVNLANHHATVTFRDITDASDIVVASMDHSSRTDVTVTP